ncbi:hypothetical protein BDZ89DRAFT_1199060 [Hymenopellis radicata]|nr:hypothetical protein BDZ89DRAFT_1199060 [Hymenopellis radicata]
MGMVTGGLSVFLGCWYWAAESSPKWCWCFTRNAVGKEAPLSKTTIIVLKDIMTSFPPHLIDFPPHILDAIVDEVADLHFPSLSSLLYTNRHFAKQCRIHLYRDVEISAISSPLACELIMQYDVGRYVKTLDITFDNEAARRPFWGTVLNTMNRLTQLKHVVLGEALSMQPTPPSQMPFARFPRMKTVHSLRLTCSMDDSPSIAPSVQIAPETLSIVHAHDFIPTIFAESVAPPIISLHKLQRIVVLETFTETTWPSYQRMFQQIQGNVNEVIIYMYSTFPKQTPFFVTVPSLIILPPLNSNFDFLRDMLQPSHAGIHITPGLKRLALVLNWTNPQTPEWSSLAKVLESNPLSFSVCITLTHTSSPSDSDDGTSSDLSEEVFNHFKDMKRRNTLNLSMHLQNTNHKPIAYDV